MKGRKPELRNVLPFKGETIKPVPDAPEWMTEKAREVWGELAGHLVAKDRLQPHYEYQFAGYCESVANFYNATACLAVDGYFFETETRNGRQQKKVAMWAVQQEALGAMMRLSALFGLSPVDEARLKVTGQGDLFRDLMDQLKNGAD
ncbi:P27 family phage terminase small subunit [Paragemmobacter ruber]|uniref:Phage terminase small subunit P27 family n=1 Tax=Paragemmobacter ruber TaxID=1985673 RepID=A0ABW9Y0C0_9RHOB|nr:P27 family phage terminase small subunit [Rhodobacter ruber]NBE05940.1 phage terminase small subunit P27 family [Rhodobacter ruber]